MLKKDLGQVFTPEWIVKLMIKDIDFKNENILEPSCGDGAFLIEIVKVILSDKSLSNNEKIHILENQITAFEIDSNWHKICLKNLNNLTKSYGIKNVKWNILCEDTLKHVFTEKYTYIIGNPPYIRLHNLSPEYREYLKNNFKFCKGTTDMYLAFYEKCIGLLAENGTLSFITPNSFLRNVGFKDFRNYIYKNKMLKDLKDFKSSNIFPASTYCAIMTLQNNHDEFAYSEYKEETSLFTTIKNIEVLNAEKWILSSPANDSFLDNISKNTNYNISIQYGLATLRDKIYITSNYKDLDDKYCIFNSHPVEKDLIRPIVKGSKVGRMKNDEYCIFPYKKTEKGYIPYSEQELSEKFPKAYDYFLLNKEELLKRDLDKNYISWFQFGRSQGIQTMTQDKLIIDPIVNPNKNVICQQYNAETLVYSGIFITGENLEEISEIIKSPDFVKYVEIYGKDMQNGFKSLTTKLIKNFI